MKMIKEFLNCLTANQQPKYHVSEERDITLDRKKIIYLVNQIEYFTNYRKERFYIAIFLFVLVALEIAMVIVKYEVIIRVMESIMAPLIISGMILYMETKGDSYIALMDYENELYDICEYIRLNDSLKENEYYILLYINTNKEKYTRKNPFDADKARGLK